MTGEQEPILKPIADMSPDEKTAAMAADLHGYYERLMAEERPRAQAQVDRQLERMRRERIESQAEDGTVYTAENKNTQLELNADYAHQKFVRSVGRTGIKAIVGDIRAIFKRRAS